MSDAPDRGMPAGPERRGRTTLLAFAAAAAWMFVYEATKQALLPDLSLWESHAITIVVSACTAAAVTYAAIVQQSRILESLAREKARSEGLILRQTALAESEAQYRLLVEASPEAIAVHRHGKLLYVNAAAARLIGVENGASLTGLQAQEFVIETDGARVPAREPGNADRAEYRLVRRDGDLIDVEAVSVVITYESAPAVQTVLRDVTLRRRLEARLVHDAFHDPLTGLPNRALFRDRVQHALARLVRSDSSCALAVLFLDLDDFKAVNDTLGHAAGDRLLIAVGERLREVTRTYDTVARLGGDEFAILLEELVDHDEAIPILERIHETLQKPLHIDGRDMRVSASIGVAYALPADDADLLLRNADVAMYEAKETGKMRHTVYAPAMYDAIVQRLVLESELRGAETDPVAAGFSLMFQPIVELASGMVHGTEALLRWAHPTRGFTTPDHFIPLAEQTGMIVSLGRWVLEQACRQLEVWRVLWEQEGLDPDTLPGVSVNISGRQLQEADFVDMVAGAIGLTAAPTRCITLEITETVIMSRSADTLETLRRLKELGVRLAIDDFGTGYSSLSYLQKFPVDVLKIDRAFVEGVARGGSDAALARTIITLGRTLGLRTVAEGIENESQRDELRTMGCHLGQGYLFARPMPAAEIAMWLLHAGGVPMTMA